MKSKPSELLAYWLMRLVTYSVIAAIGYILLDIVWNGLRYVDWEFLSQPPRRGGLEGGILTPLVGTFWLVLLAMLFSLPLGVACAVYLTEYAKPGKFVDFVRLAITTLAGVPSVVFGLFGLGLFVLYFGWGTSMLSGGATLGVLILPTIIVASEESLRAVPGDFRAASMALGATKWYTIRKVVLPFAMPGMLTGSILGLGRAAGETAPILLTAAVFFKRGLPTSMFEGVMALPYHLYISSTQMQNPERAREIQYGTALVLLALVLGVNLIAIALRGYFRRKIRWQ